jgi:hypothetical protein
MTRRFTQVPLCRANTRPRGVHQPCHLQRARQELSAASWYEPISGARRRLSAEIPSVAGANRPHAVNHTVSGIRVRPESMPASPRCPGDSRHTHPVPVIPDIGAPMASGWRELSSVHIVPTPIRIPVLFCPHAPCRLPEPDRDQTRRQVHQAVTAPRRRQGCGAGARGGWHALVNAATARQGTSQASNARPARTRYAPTLSRSGRPGAPIPSRPRPGCHRPPAVLRQRGGTGTGQMRPAQDRQPRFAPGDGRHRGL